MQVRYQLRHSPRLLPGLRATRGILANAPRRREIGPRARSGCRPRAPSRCRTPSGGRRVVVEDGPAAVVHAAQVGREVSGASRAVASRPTFRQAPWVTTIAGLAGSSAARHLVERRQDAGADLRGRLLARGTDSSCGQPGGVLAGCRSANSAVVSPDARPRRTRAGAGPPTSRPASSADVRRGLAGAGQVAGPEPAGRSAARYGAAARAWRGRCRRGRCRRDPGPAERVPRGRPCRSSTSRRVTAATSARGWSRPRAARWSGSRARAARGRRTAAPPRAGCGRRSRRSR